MKVLSKGGNAPLAGGSVTMTVAARDVDADVSALLLSAGGTVRTDDDLVFYNHPSQDGVSVSGTTVTAHVRAIPSDVASVLLVASADPAHPGTVFTTAPSVTISQSGSAELSFTPPDFTDRETVVVLAELYRRGEGWKVRAVGQGYASGLAGLATDYGVDVDDASSVDPGDTITPLRAGDPSASLVKVESRAPALIGSARKAEEALTDTGISGRRAAVYLVLSHDYDTQELYESFAIQAFAERVLALSANLDDDGTVPVVFSGDREPFLEDISLDNYRGRIGDLHTQVDWGWGRTLNAMRRVTSHYQASGVAVPALVIMHVSAEPDDKAEIRSLLQNTNALGVFWLFVGFGRGKLAFFKNLNASTSTTFTNVAFYDAGKNPGAVPHERFYSGLVHGFASWLR